MRSVGLTGAFVAALIAMSAPASAQLFGPGKFKVEQTDDRFSTDDLATYVGRNNRVSKKSVAGGTHIDAKGMFIEPLAMQRKSDKSLVNVGFYIHNETEFDTTYGSPNRIGTLRRIAFIPDGGQPISVAIADGHSKWSDRTSYNTISRSASSDIQESGFADVTVEQFLRIAGATTIAVKIEGTERSVIYDEKDISKSFLENLKAFAAAHVRTALRASN